MLSTYIFIIMISWLGLGLVFGKHDIITLRLRMKQTLKYHVVVCCTGTVFWSDQSGQTRTEFHGGI